MAHAKAPGRQAAEKRYPRVILATACVPWNEDYTFAEGIFRDEIRNLARRGIRHVYLFGTAGEGYAVTDAQFDAIARVFVDETGTLARDIGERIHPMIGLIHLSMGTVCERIRRARDLGVREFQLSLPSWGAVNEREMFAFFHGVCDAFPDCRFLHYNLMRAKKLVTADEYARLAAEIPNLVATKNGTSDLMMITALEQRAGALRHFFTEPGFAYACQVGAPGLLISLASTHFCRAHRYFEAGCRRDLRTLQAMQAELMDLLQALMAATAPGSFMDGAYDKMFCKVYDPRFPLRLLPPYESSTDAMFRKFIGALRKRQPDWLPRRKGSVG